MDITICKKFIRSALGKEILKIQEQTGKLYISLKPSSVLRCMSILYSDQKLKFESLSDSFAVNFEGKGISIYYQLLSCKLNSNIFIVTNLGAIKIMQSLTILFENANWLEREIFDMFGVQFNDHPDMRRILNNHDHSCFPMM